MHQEASFECVVCPRKFLTNRDRLEHMKEHSGQEQFMCASCGGNFDRKAYSRHFKTCGKREAQDQDRPPPRPKKPRVPCPECGKEVMPGSMDVHRAKMHQVVTAHSVSPGRKKVKLPLQLQLGDGL